ncbi:unspecific monooxygenase [Tsukamurella pulmonis]|uniref:Unspecific monooxygenase n=1 Tax=Tsukamurella pulmonis TaxID=47312 RepID=A0A1H1A6N5_9ACTN|nr:cytochrome P450 [Tsukamurella pulmonis]SDQ35368.1 unspecific monooxygenase [Tsukamurella pulmonis]SUQ39459.1 Cytochrome P450(BM-3) [Tsukamurella pulmonis]
MDTIPHPPYRLPVLGDVFGASRTTPTQHEAAMARKLGGVYERKIINDVMIVVGSADAAADACDEEAWSRALPGPGQFLRRLVPNGLFTVRNSDPTWGSVRSALEPMFTQPAMRRYHTAMASVIDEMCDHLRSRNGKPVNANDLMTRLTVEIIAQAGFGYRSAGFDVPLQDDDFLQAVRAILEWSSTESNSLPIVSLIGAGDRLAKAQRSAEVVRAPIRELVERRLADYDPAAADDATDILAALLPTGLPVETIVDQAVTFLIAGHETTAALLETALYYAAEDNRQEVLRRPENTPASAVSYEDIPRQRDVQRFLRECLRLHPPAPGFFRIAKKDTKLGAYRVPKGRVAFVLALAAQRDPKSWGPDADQFRPERFDRGEQLGFFKPFSTGPRDCIGRVFAMNEATFAISQLATAFDIIPATPRRPLAFVERATLRPEPRMYTFTARS